MNQSISMTRIILGLGMIVFVGAMVVAGTGAFFSDTETSEGNVFTAGAIDLEVDNTSYGFDWNDPDATDPDGAWGLNPNHTWELSNLDECGESGEEPCFFFNFVDLKPGDYGEDTISLHVQNDAWACMAFDVTGTPENGINDPEEDAGDVTDDPDGGELQNYLSFAFWEDDGDNVYEDDEGPLLFNGFMADLESDWQTIADSDAGGSPLQAEETYYVGKFWCFGEIVEDPEDDDQNGDNPPTADTTGFECLHLNPEDNEAQTDGVEVDVHFYSEQLRHNDEFMCSELPPVGDEEPEGRPVGAALGDYSAPSVCDATVLADQSIQTALDAAGTGETVCVDSSYTGLGDDVALRMETTGVTLAALVQGTVLDVPVVLSADGVTVTGFEGTIGQAESLSEIAAFYFDNDATNASLTFNEVNGGVGAAVLTETGADNSGGLIENNVLSGATQGIYLNPHTGSIMIRFNDIDNNAAGIGGLNGAMVIANEFEHTTPSSEAIGIDETFDANPATINQNNFLDDMRVNTYDTAFAGTIASTIDAEDNFWGPNGGAAQTDDSGGGTIDFDPEALVMFPHN